MIGRPVRKKSGGPVGFDLTPMIDVVFNLIIFFVLINSFSSMEVVSMDLPSPDRSQAQRARLTDRVVINCLPADPVRPSAGGVLCSIGPLRVASLDELSQRLAGAKAANPNLQVVLRADKRLAYSEVRRVMQVVATNQIQMMNIVALVSENQPE